MPSASLFQLLTVNLGMAGEIALQLLCLLLFQRTQLWFPGPTSGDLTTFNYGCRGSDTLFWALQVPTCYARAHTPTPP